MNHFLQKEANRLIKIKSLKIINNFHWTVPTFIIPKIHCSVRFISDFRELRKTKQKGKLSQFLIFMIYYLIQKVLHLTYATSLDLTMGNFQNTLCPASRKQCRIVLPRGKFEYQILPMRLCYSPSIFQEKMNELFNGLEYIRAYIDY